MHFPGVELIRSAAALQPLLDAVRGARRVAIDTEFHSERHYYPRLMLLQLRADDGEAWLVDPLSDIDLAPLGDALSGVPLLLHGAAMDLQILQRTLGLRPGPVFDTQVAAGFVGDGYPIRLQELVRRHLGRHLPKTETLSDWSQRPLSDEQLRYAADDVLLLGPLADAIRAALDARGTAGIAAACMQEMAERALVPDDPAGCWRTVPGAHLLDEGERAILAELAAWRELSARERDVPRNTIASDAVLLDLARRQPGSVDALRANRRLPAQVWRRDGAAVLACVARAAGRVSPPGIQRPRPWLDLVWAAARACGRERGVAAELVLTEPFLDLLSVGGFPTGWRHEALGLHFESFLRGGSGIDIHGSFSVAEK